MTFYGKAPTDRELFVAMARFFESHDDRSVFPQRRPRFEEALAKYRAWAARIKASKKAAA